LRLSAWWISVIVIVNLIGDYDMNTRKLAISVAALTLATTAIAQNSSNPIPQPHIAVLVEIATPKGVTRPIIEAGMDKSQAVYRKIPGLIRKYFTVGDAGNFGGMYLWTDRASAQAWFSDAWRAKAVATYGSDPKVSYFEVPIVLDGAAKGK
jgi:hypothetical protein